MRLSESDIKEINEQVGGWDEGIFREPNWIPTHIKEPVIYKRHQTGGYSGGNCWGGIAAPYVNGNDEKFEVLDVVLRKLCPDLSYLKYREIEKLIHTNNETEFEYYGNSTDWEVKYIILSKLYDFLGI